MRESHFVPVTRLRPAGYGAERCASIRRPLQLRTLHGSSLHEEVRIMEFRNRRLRAVGIRLQSNGTRSVYRKEVEQANQLKRATAAEARLADRREDVRLQNGRRPGRVVYCWFDS